MPLFDVKVVKEMNCLIFAKTKKEAERKASESLAFYDFSHGEMYKSTAELSKENPDNYINGIDGWAVEKTMTIPCIDLRKINFFTKENIKKYSKITGTTKQYLIEQSVPNERDTWTVCGPRTPHRASEVLRFTKDQAKMFNIPWNEEYITGDY